jgi:predicted NUDIX family NTP pyrophosphohydrolase
VGKLTDEFRGVIKMARTSAGLLMYRRREGNVEVFLVHHGGPFWEKKDLGSWSIPKGLFDEGEDPLAAARREFKEETGCAVTGEFIPLTTRKQPGGKVVHAWAVEGDCDASSIKSNIFSMEWPPRSGKLRMFPEVDRAGWFTIDVAREKILKGQVGFVEELVGILS